MPIRSRSPRRPAERATSRPRRLAGVVDIPRDATSLDLDVDGRIVRLTNLQKQFWGDEGITKGDLLRYYAAVAPALLPHLRDRAMVMKRYPDGAYGKCFWMKRAPEPRPAWVETCTITHKSENVIDFPVVQDLATLLWIVNLGCIDLNPWYARCDDIDGPDWLHFDLDPGPGAGFDDVRAAALVVREALETFAMPTFAKTTGSSGIHVYVPIERGPRQKEVWTFAKAFARAIAADHPDLLTAEYRVADRPRGRVLVDYNQNAWGRTLASIYSPRPKPGATVSTPVTWEEVARGVTMRQFTIRTVPARLAELGDLWAPLLSPRGRYDLSQVL
jgi:bifunctional non-homologous end joining protein LigD